MKHDNPLVTFAVISYNQEQFIAEAIESALAQTYSPLEIVISDDCSTDATFSIIEKIIANYAGPHTIILNKNQPNLGIAGNVNKVWELSSGEFVVFQGGDDASLPYRTDKLVTAWQTHIPRPDIVFSGVILTDESGKPIGEREAILLHTPTVAETLTGRRPFVAGGCAAAYTRAVHFFTGPLSDGVLAEDFVYSFRALLGNGVVGIPDMLVMYRQHSQSIIGELRSANTQGVPSIKFLKAHLALLLEYQRAMNAHCFNSIYLRWRLARRIKSTECELQVLASGNCEVVTAMLWALATFRPRFLLVLLKRIFN